MSDELIAIGQVAKASGLTVSALRFYDSAGLLVPAEVDARSGYRRYRRAQIEDAQLIASLRRVGMPLPEISGVLWSESSAESVALLHNHLRRLEHGLADARRHLAVAERKVLNRTGVDMTKSQTRRTWDIPAASLADGLRAVIFASGTDPEYPMLAGVLFDVDALDGELRLVATDRYRLAIATVGLPASTQHSARAIAPIPFAEELIRAVEGRAGEVRLEIDDAEMALVVGDRTIIGDALDDEYPDYQRLLSDRSTHQVGISADDLRNLVADGPPTCVLEFDGHPRIGVNREFLLEAVDAARAAELVLELDGPISPLAIRAPAKPHRHSILMPVELAHLPG